MALAPDTTQVSEGGLLTRLGDPHGLDSWVDLFTDERAPEDADVTRGFHSMMPFQFCYDVRPLPGRLLPFLPGKVFIPLKEMAPRAV